MPILGICDLLSGLFLFAGAFLTNRIPLYSDVLDAIEISRQLDSLMPILIASLSVCLFVSVLFFWSVLGFPKENWCHPGVLSISTKDIFGDAIFCFYNHSI